MNKKYIVSLILVFAMLALGACGSKDEPKVDKETKKEGGVDVSDLDLNSEGGLELPEADLAGIPEVVAEINDKKITKEAFEVAYTSQFQQAAMQSMMSGEEVDQGLFKEMILETMIGQELLIQAANDAKLTATDEAISAALTELAVQNGLESKEAFVDALTEQGMTEDEINGLMVDQVKVDQLIASEVGEIDTTDAELQEVYDDIKKRSEEQETEEEFPSFEDVKTELVGLVQNQKEAEIVQAFVEKLRGKADITINL